MRYKSGQSSSSLDSSSVCRHDRNVADPLWATISIRMASSLHLGATASSPSSAGLGLEPSVPSGRKGFSVRVAVCGAPAIVEGAGELSCSSKK